MTYLNLENVSLSYPVFGTKSRSLKHSILKVTTGGKLQSGDGTVVVDALQAISLQLNPGDKVGLIGHNGAGKSTLLRVMAGIYEPTRGKLQFEGSVGTLLDLTLGMDMEATGYENIKIRGVILGLSNKQIAAVTPDIETFTEMGDFLSMPAKTYSTGMLLRLAFAISTTIAPNILLIDEAVGAGDAHFIEKAQRRLASFVHQSDILVIASHENAFIRQFCNKVLWLEHGTVKAFGPTEHVIKAYEHAVQEENKIE